MNVFDMIGPVMIGPSSSHTAGAARIGYLARCLLAQPPLEARIGLHGSFAKTFRGHGTDKALTAGILGMRPDDSRLRDAPKLALACGLKLSIGTVELRDAHPNTALIELRGADREISLQAASIGGGSVRVTRLNGMDVNISGQYDCLIVIHQDAPGTIAAVTETIAQRGINICSFSLSRQAKGGLACMCIEVDGHIDATIQDALSALPRVVQATLLSLT